MITSFFVPKVTRDPCENLTNRTEANRAREIPESSKTETGKKPKLSEVDEMLSYLDDDINKENSWKTALERHTSSQSFGDLAKFLASERKFKIIYPPPADTFSAFNWTHLENVKVVVVGQDPYHGPQQAHGLCFSVRRGVAIPPSLRNIYKELANDPDVGFPGKKGMPRHGYLERWAKQGVLMLNSVMTVRKGEANSHKRKGWENFTDEVIRVLAHEAKKNDKGLVLLLWGNPAAEKAQAIINSGGKHIVIRTSHPSPLGATKTDAPFIGSRCFSRTNKALVELGHEPVDWNVDGELS